MEGAFCKDEGIVLCLDRNCLDTLWGDVAYELVLGPNQEQ